ncbi:MAG: Clp protease N-terminal domain-containing protein [Candidatus Dormibacteraceae bacterium]
MPKATTVRFTDEVFARLDQASARTGLPVNSIVIAACLEWMKRHVSAAEPDVEIAGTTRLSLTLPPRWATMRRAIEQAIVKPGPMPTYPFEQFSDHAKQLLTGAQREANQAGHSYIGTEHLLLAVFGDPHSHAMKVLEAVGVTEASVRPAIAAQIGRKKRAIPRGVIPTSKVKKVIEIAFRLCSASGESRVGTHHILLGLVTEGEGIAAHVLTNSGVTREAVVGEAERLTDPEV